MPEDVVEQYRKSAKKAADSGDYLRACDLAVEGLKLAATDPKLRQLHALALARMGSHAEARRILTELAEVWKDEETLGILARTYKDLWLESRDSGDLARAYQSYTDAYGSQPDHYWTGINAATLAFASGDRPEATRLALEVETACRALPPTGDEDERYWRISTVGEAALVRGEIDEACKLYREASEVAQAKTGNLASTLRNARILLRFYPPEVGAQVEAAIHMPGIAVFSGHRTDAPDRPQVRFPESSVAAVSAALRDYVERNRIRTGYASAASGGDLLFLKAVRAAGGKTHIVLPCSREQFLAESVGPADGDWAKRYAEELKEAAEVLPVSEEHLVVGDVGYDYANQVLHGLALARARQFGVPLDRIALWDGNAGLPGGTGDVVASWRSAGHRVTVIDPITASISEVAPGDDSPAPQRPASTGFGAVTRAMIFADAHHFSKLTEAQMPAFIERFMGTVATLVDEARPRPLFQNTWGDGLFLVFERAADAGRLAMRLARAMQALDREAHGLPPTLTLRIALHAGPVYEFADRIVGRTNYIGAHVNRTARIEPITPPGQVYGTHAFTALSALEAPGEFRCDYVGRVPLAKGFGEFAMYRVQSART